MPKGVAEPSEQFENTNEGKLLLEGPSEPNGREDECKPASVKLILEKELHLGSQCKLLTVKDLQLFLCHMKGVLAEEMCYFIEELYIGR